MTGVHIAPADLVELRQAISDFLSQKLSFDAAVKQIRTTGERLQWDWLGPPVNRDRNWRIAQMLRTCASVNYALERSQELVEMTIWVIKCDPLGCPAHHNDIDGLARPADDHLWRFLAPPLDWDCGCYILGATSDAGIVRMGGDQSKTVPDWVYDRPLDGPFGLASQGPDEFILALVRAIANGQSPLPDAQ